MIFYLFFTCFYLLKSCIKVKVFLKDADFPAWRKCLLKTCNRFWSWFEVHLQHKKVKLIFMNTRPYQYPASTLPAFELKRNSSYSQIHLDHQDSLSSHQSIKPLKKSVVSYFLAQSSMWLVQWWSGFSLPYFGHVSDQVLYTFVLLSTPCRLPFWNMTALEDNRFLVVTVPGCFPACFLRDFPHGDISHAPSRSLTCHVFVIFTPARHPLITRTPFILWLLFVSLLSVLKSSMYSSAFVNINKIFVWIISECLYSMGLRRYKTEPIWITSSLQRTFYSTSTRLVILWWGMWRSFLKCVIGWAGAIPCPTASFWPSGWRSARPHHAPWHGQVSAGGLY